MDLELYLDLVDFINIIVLMYMMNLTVIIPI